MSTPSPAICPACGASLAGSPAGICVPCLGRAALGPLRTAGNSARQLQRLGDYELVEEIARGGMGVVYRARQVRLKRFVAVKLLLRGDLANQEARRRFELEAEASAALQHPGIVTVFEVGESDGEHFIAMELIEGPSLDELLRSGPLAPERAARCLHALAEAVAYAHGRGVLHRDLKPSNILMEANERPRITDFGMARLTDSSASLTLDGRTFGSPNYMPPEQADPFRGSAGPTSDVFSLGAVLYHVLTGRPPFVGATLAATLHQVLDRDPIPPRRLRPEVPVDLETICLKCLEKIPAQRYASAQLLADDLAGFLRGEPVMARPISQVARLARWAVRHPALAIVSTCLLLALMAIAVISSLTSVRIARSHKVAEGRAEESRRNLIRSLVVTGNRYLAADDAQRALPWFLRAWEMETNSSERGVHETRVASTMNYIPDLIRIWSSDRRIEWAQFSPDGSKVVFADGSSRVQVWPTEPYHTNHVVLDRGGPVYFARFSPDGKRLLAAGENRSMLFDPAGTKVSGSLPHQLHFRSVAARQFPLFSADGTRLLTAFSNRLTLRHSGNGRPAAPAIAFSTPIQAVALFADGLRCAVATADQRIALVDALTGLQFRADLRTAEPVRVLALNGDGSRLAAVSGGNRINVWTLDDTNRAPLEFFHATYTYQCDFVMEGRAILTTSYDNSARLWDATTGTLLHVFRHDGGVYRALEIQTNALALSCSWDGTVRAWELNRGSLASYPHLVHSGPVLSLDFDPVQHRVMTGSWDGSVRLYKMGRGLPVTLRGRPVASPLFHERFAALGLGTTNAFLMDAREGTPLSPSLSHVRRLRAFGISSSPETFATLTTDGRVTVWNAALGKKLIELPIADPQARDIELTPDGRRLLTINTNNFVQWHDAANGQLLGGRSNSLPPIRSLALSPDSQSVALVGMDSRVRIVSGDDGQMLAGPFAPAGGAQSIWWSPDSAVVAVASGQPGGLDLRDQVVRFWDARSGQETGVELRHRDDIRAVAFSADGQWIGTGSEDYYAQIWERQTGRAVGQPLRHNGWVVAVAFSPNGKILATGSSDGFLRLWETATGEAIGPAIRAKAEPKFLAFDASGESVVAGFADEYLRWDLTLSPNVRANLAQHVVLASGLRLNEDGVLHFLTGEELAERWRVHHGSLPDHDPRR